MGTALIIGGTKFIGRHVVDEFLDAGYQVSIFNRGMSDNPFSSETVTRIEGDRTVKADLERAAEEVDTDVVVDCVGYHPREVREATSIFADVDAYVYVSSTAAFEPGGVALGKGPGLAGVLKREGVTPLCDCTPEQAVDDSYETYAPRKAAGDRMVFEAAAAGVNAMSVRPSSVYGPHDYSERHDYWIDRCRRYDRVVVPGDGSRFAHRVYVEDLASAIRIVAERGDPGEAYNTGDQTVLTIDTLVECMADALDTSVEVVLAGEDELAKAGLELTDFVLCRRHPYVVSTQKIEALGWKSTPVETALQRTIDDHLESERDGKQFDPGREREERVVKSVLG